MATKTKHDHIVKTDVEGELERIPDLDAAETVASVGRSSRSPHRGAAVDR